jgi:hypothetical protein
MNETRVESTTLRAVAHDDGREILQPRDFATGVPQPGNLTRCWTRSSTSLPLPAAIGTIPEGSSGR